MFTGLIQSVGKVKSHPHGISIAGTNSFAPLSLGDSVAVDGVCLTVAEILPDGFVAHVSEETLSRTNLFDKACKGEFVNLEPALRFSDRLGGHLVCGHVDGLGKVLAIDLLKSSWHIEIEWDNPFFGRYICDKASIAIDGTSLTVTDSSEGGKKFSVAVISHTWENTSLKNYIIGSRVNLEADLFAKYTESILEKSTYSSFKESIHSPQITEEWLSNNGWI